ncbi:MAG: cell division protein FtsZ [Candidatus Altiarchaeum hamiconexum]|uniref:Cell division protein FtsZ n=1 Tax=Candidatus Altarchaeum hamiconexum TaxID=1803513 RepID=A0A8J8CFL0_9ARCH|nr:cell division protein FtsZ [Candidatus Altarchaeum hamiconexum]
MEPFIYGNSEDIFKMGRESSNENIKQQRSTILGAEGVSVENPKICVVGVGGGGCNTIRRLSEMRVTHEVELIAMNTDVKQLRMTENVRIKKILIGAKLTGGQGAGGYPTVGEEAAVASNQDIAQALEGARIVFVSAGMGGGTGTGGAPIVAKIARDKGAIVISVITFPFRLERARVVKAREGIEKLKQVSHTVIVLDNNLLVQYAPNLPMDEAFKIADDVIGKAIDGITHSILIPSLINLDLADFMTIMKTGGIAMISVGQGAGPKKVEEAVAAVRNQPLLEVDTMGATGALIHITGGSTLSLNDANKAGDMLTENVSQNAPVIWGARVNEKMGDKVEIVLIITGIKSNLLSGGSNVSMEGGKINVQSQPTQQQQFQPQQTQQKRVYEPTWPAGRYGGTSQTEQQPVYTQPPQGYEVQQPPQRYGVQQPPQGYEVQQPHPDYAQPSKPQSRQRPILIEDTEAFAREQEELKNIMGAEGIELEDPKIVVVGVGGGGGNSITRLSEAGLSKTCLRSTRLVAINTDKRALVEMVKEDKVPISKVLIGGKMTRGMGAGGYPDVGEKAAEESFNLLQQAIGKPQLVFLGMGMGGGTGTGAGPVVAKIAKQAGAIVVGIVTYPFNLERARQDKAKKGIERLMQYCDTVVVIDNEKLRAAAPNMPMNEAFMFADKVIQDAVQGITETIMVPSLINLDFADIKSTMGNKEISLICVGEGEGPDKVKQAIVSTFNKPLLDVNYGDINGALIHITGGMNMTLDEAHTIGEGISKGVKKNANVVWGARIDQKLGDKIKVVAILTGVKGKSIPVEGGKNSRYISSTPSIFDDMGITYL